MLRFLTIVVLATAVTTASGWTYSPRPGQAPLGHRDAEAIAEAVARAANEGLPSPNLRGLVADIDSGNPALVDRADRILSNAAIQLAAEEHGMRIDPRQVDKALALRAPYNAATDFAAARQSGRIASWVRGLAPQQPEYQNLVTARAAYAATVAAGGWGVIEPGIAPKPGDADPRMPALRQRLVAEGYLSAKDATPAPAPAPAPVATLTPTAYDTAASPAPAPVDPALVYDPGLVKALKAFQSAHALAADGVLSAATLTQLNVSPRARLAAIDVNLERMRWLPRRLPSDRIEVDTGDPHAVLYHQGVAILSMRAIAGRPEKATPTFASEVVAVEFNPPWYVPSEIARKELYGRSYRYLSRSGYHIVSGHLVQRAGPRSALGFIKFEIPDAFDVYLHDTPSRGLFSRSSRWLSHGCVRLANPRDLAAALLAPQGYDRAAIDTTIETKTTSETPLKVKMPVFIVYRTVLADPAGRAVFRPDVYGWDGKLAQALMGT